MKVVTVLGARPQFIKASAVSAAIANHNARFESDSREALIEEVIVHTGQHFDANMSDVFFEQLKIPAPKYHLGVSGVGHGAMTGRMLESIEAVLMKERPDWVLVYGDTNSTLAGALAAVKLGVPVAHVEAGLRSHNPNMPEEINRVLTDRVSTLLLCPTAIAVQNLRTEGFPFAAPGGRTQRIAQVGDVMLDVVLRVRQIAEQHVTLEQFGVTSGQYALCTLHRQENTDCAQRLDEILAALREIAQSVSVLLPLHPRTRQRVAATGSPGLTGITVLDPLPYLEMQRLLMGAWVVLTDSGGLQKEALFHRVPCVTLRDETEWTETVDVGWNRLAGADRKAIVTAFREAKPCNQEPPPLFGGGESASLVVGAMMDSFRTDRPVG